MMNGNLLSQEVSNRVHRWSNVVIDFISWRMCFLFFDLDRRLLRLQSNAECTMIRHSLIVHSLVTVDQSFSHSLASFSRCLTVTFERPALRFPTLKRASKRKAGTHASGVLRLNIDWVSPRFANAVHSILDSLGIVDLSDASQSPAAQSIQSYRILFQISTHIIYAQKSDGFRSVRMRPHHFSLANQRFFFSQQWRYSAILQIPARWIAHSMVAHAQRNAFTASQVGEIVSHYIQSPTSCKRLSDTPSFQLVKQWYEQSFAEVLEFKNAEINPATLQR